MSTQQGRNQNFSKRVFNSITEVQMQGSPQPLRDPEYLTQLIAILMYTLMCDGNESCSYTCVTPAS